MWALAAWAAWALVACARELDPGSCGARFDVQRDKIIRTEESRDMGARYLSELDVGTRHECLRLCCETDACDVFVYEEKGPGSCYLFNCGPPEDFRCKFTAHSNFSSGVLALSRRLAELQDQERLAQRERELASLRSGAGSTAAPPAAPTAAPEPPAPAAHAPLTEPPPPPQPAPAVAVASAKCSRYQFACRRGGECIAVYNACDGVAQCADGSDEAPELGCPEEAPRLPPPTTRAPPAPTAPPKPLQEEADVGLEPRWPHRLAQAQPPRRYNDMPHIFSHKGGLLQEPAAPFPPFEAWPRRAWPPAPAPPSGMDSMPVDRGWGPSAGAAGGGPYWPEPDPRRAWPVPQPRPDQEMPVYMPPKTMPELAPEYAGQQHSATLRDGPKKGAPAAPAPPGEAPLAAPTRPPPAPVDTTTNKIVKESKPAQTAAVAAANLNERASSEHSPQRHYLEDEHDGRSERPPAAVLLLVLGLGLTAATGAMLAWRARAARRRLRRGKTPLAHDADYLVNGMYL